jgi:hypothetical protein
VLSSAQTICTVDVTQSIIVKRYSTGIAFCAISAFEKSPSEFDRSAELAIHN